MVPLHIMHDCTMNVNLSATNARTFLCFALVSFFSVQITDNPAWEEILQQVADLKPATNYRNGAKLVLCEIYFHIIS